MGQPQILTRGARISGTVVCALITLISAGWIVRDLTKTDGPSRLWWMWSGLPAGFSGRDLWVTGLTDLLLTVVCVTVAFTAMRSTSSASAFVSAGILTVALRVPALWILTSDWTQLWGSDALRDEVLASAAVQVTLGVVLLGIAGWGRAPAATGHGYPPSPEDEPPARPSSGVAVTAFVLLGAAALVLLAWEAYLLEEFGWEVYKTRLTGGRNAVLSLLSTPQAWADTAVALLALVAAFAVLNRAPSSRPLGMTAAAAILLWGVVDVSAAIKADAFEGIADAQLLLQLQVASALFYTVAGLIALVGLSHGVEEPGDPSYGYTRPYDPPAPYGPRGY